jgi:hypothetical protein
MKHLQINDILEMHEENCKLKNQMGILMELIGKIKHFQPKIVDDYLREAGLNE